MPTSKDTDDTSLAAALCDAVDISAMMRHLEVFAQREKLSGTEEELESFRYLKACLDNYGLRTQMIFHDAYISLPGKARIEIDGKSPDCITHSFSSVSPAGGVAGEVVYVGEGKPEDFAKVDVRGKIALLEHIATPTAALRASKGGAVGQIHISPHKHLHEMCISPVWGNPSQDQLHLLPTTVVVSVRKADGDALKQRVQSGETVEAVLHAAVDTGWRKTPILQADLDAAAPDADDTFVLMSGHHDTWYFGVMDNGGANATMLELARLFAPHREQMRRSLRFCFWSGHSQGRYSGSAWYADVKWEELEARCVAHVNIDSTGGQGNTILADALASAELLDLASRAVRIAGNQELDGHRMSRAGDQSFWGIGIPSIFMGMGEQPLGSENPMGALLGTGGNRKSAGFGWWWHTPDDTLDKMSPELLVRDACIYIHAVSHLLTDRILPLDYARQARTLIAELQALSSGVGHEIDLSTIVERAEQLQRRATKLLDEAGTRDAAAVNKALMMTSRALVPIDYTRGDRFDHDPALGQQPYPVLDPLRRLASTKPGSDEARFAVVSARRAVNRVAFALNEANAALGAGGPTHRGA